MSFFIFCNSGTKCSAKTPNAATKIHKKQFQAHLNRQNQSKNSIVNLIL